MRLSQKLAKLGHFSTFQPGLPRPVGWREKKFVKKLGKHVNNHPESIKSIFIKKYSFPYLIWPLRRFLVSPFMKLEHNMNFENSTCGSRLPTEIYWTWQDGRVFALALAFVGLIGTGLNSLVLIGVGGNVKLGTTVNKLLIWICSMAILESIIGIGVKTLILGKEIKESILPFFNF